MATASILGERCKALTNKSCEQKSLFAKERAIVSKKTSYSVVLALHVTRTTDALGKPYDMKLARCYRFPAGVTMAIQEGGLSHVDVMRWGGSNYRTAKGQQEKGRARGRRVLGGSGQPMPSGTAPHGGNGDGALPTTPHEQRGKGLTQSKLGGHVEMVRTVAGMEMDRTVGRAVKPKAAARTHDQPRLQQ